MSGCQAGKQIETQVPPDAQWSVGGAHGGYIACSADGSRVFAAGGPAGNQVFCWQGANRTKRLIVSLPSRPVALAASADGRFLVTVDEDSHLKVWDANSSKRIVTLAGYPWGPLPTFSSDSKLLGFLDDDDSKGVQALRLSDGKIVRSESVDDVRQFAFDSRGRLILGARDEVKPAEHTAVRLHLPVNVECLVLAPNGNNYATFYDSAGPAGTLLYVIAGETTVLQIAQLPGFVDRLVAVNPPTLIVKGSDGRGSEFVEFYDLESKRVRPIVTDIHNAQLWAAADRDGHNLFVLGSDGYIRHWVF